jgi:hypothetical protein
MFAARLLPVLRGMLDEDPAVAAQPRAGARCHEILPAGAQHA